MPVFPFVAFAIVLLPIFIISFQQKRYAKKLLTATGGTMSLLGDICFRRCGQEFHIQRISNRSTTRGTGGTYPVLWGYLAAASDFQFIGNVNARKYKYLFGFPANAVFVKIEDIEIAIVGRNGESTQRLKTSFEQNPQSKKMALQLFRKNTDFCKMGSRYMISSLSIRKRWIYEYVLLPDSIYSETDMSLDPYLQALIDLLSQTQDSKAI